MQELTYSGKNKDIMIELAVRNYENNTDNKPSQHHRRVIKRTFQELSSRTMGQSVRIIFPNFMSGNYGEDDLVVMRDGWPVHEDPKDYPSGLNPSGHRESRSRRRHVDWTSSL